MEEVTYYVTDGRGTNMEFKGIQFYYKENAVSYTKSHAEELIEISKNHRKDNGYPTVNYCLKICQS